MEYQQLLISNRIEKIPATICIPDTLKEFSLVLMAHGFCSNRNEYGAFEDLAHKLMTEGIASIRIDFAGCNDSKESYLLNTIENNVVDLRCAFKYMKDNYNIKEVGIVGYSLGGKVAVHYIEKYKDIKTAVYFAPAITNGLNWHNSSLELGRAKEMEEAYKIAIKDGYYNYLNTFDNSFVPLSKDFVKQCLTYKTFDIFNSFEMPSLMIYGDKDDIIPLSVYQEIIENNNNQNFKSFLIKNANHGFGMWDNKKTQFDVLIMKAFEFLKDNLI